MISIQDVPFLAAHCRFENQTNSDPDDRHQPIETLRGRGYRVARG